MEMFDSGKNPLSITLEIDEGQSVEIPELKEARAGQEIFFQAKARIVRNSRGSLEMCLTEIVAFERRNPLKIN